MKKNKVKLYNVMFPVWLLWLFPQIWLIALPVNFLIDLPVLMLTMHHVGVTDLQKNIKCVILKTWLCGFAADFVGALVLTGIYFLPIRDDTTFGLWWYARVAYPIVYNAFSTAEGFLIVTVCVALSAFVIYLLNYKFCLKKAALTEIQKKKTALSLAVFTAPYLFYVPLDFLDWI